MSTYTQAELDTEHNAQVTLDTDRFAKSEIEFHSSTEQLDVISMGMQYAHVKAPLAILLDIRSEGVNVCILPAV